MFFLIFISTNTIWLKVFRKVHLCCESFQSMHAVSMVILCWQWCVYSRLARQAPSSASWPACWWRCYRVGPGTRSQPLPYSNSLFRSSYFSFWDFYRGSTTGLTCLASSSASSLRLHFCRTWHSENWTGDGRLSLLWSHCACLSASSSCSSSCSMSSHSQTVLAASTSTVFLLQPISVKTWASPSREILLIAHFSWNCL